MPGRLLRRTIINVCESQLLELDRSPQNVPAEHFLASLEVLYAYPHEDYLSWGAHWDSVTLADYANGWYVDSVERMMSLYHRHRPYGARWRVSPAGVPAPPLEKRLALIGVGPSSE